MAITTLKGEYGKLVTVTLGAEVTSGTTLTDETWYLVTGVDSSSSGLPSGAAVGYLLRSDGTEALAGDDAAKPLTKTDLCDIQSWNMDFSRADIDVTTLCDDQKRYLAGKTDVNGTLEGVFKIGTTDQDGGLLNKFVALVDAASGSYDIDAIDDSAIYAELVTQKNTDAGETEQFYFAPLTINAFSQGASAGDEAQTFSSGFRISPDDTNGVKLAYYSYTHSA
jgi:hypothetical protein